MREVINSVLSRNTNHLYSRFATSSLSLQANGTMLHERKGSVIYKDVDWTPAAYNTYDYNLQWRSHQFSQLVYRAIAISYAVCLYFSESTHTESSWSAVLPVLGYRLPTADVPGFLNCLRDTATAKRDSLSHPVFWNFLLGTHPSRHSTIAKVMCCCFICMETCLPWRVLLTACCLATGACNSAILKCTRVIFFFVFSNILLH
jgi:hypothetical protein